jgi:hypothetical protein
MKLKKILFVVAVTMFMTGMLAVLAVTVAGQYEWIGPCFVLVISGTMLGLGTFLLDIKEWKRD